MFGENMNKYINFGKRLSSLRDKMGLSQIELAKRTGISRQSIHNYESGSVIPRASIMIKLATVLKVSVDYLYNGDFDLSVNEHMTYKEAIINYIKLKESNIFNEEIIQNKNNKPRLVISTCDPDFINFVTQLKAILSIEDSISSETLNNAISELLNSYEIAILPSDKDPFKKQ